MLKAEEREISFEIDAFKKIGIPNANERLQVLETNSLKDSLSIS